MFSEEQGRKWCVTMFPYFATGVVDTGGKFSTDINNTRETGRKNLPPVALTPVVNLDWPIFENLETVLMGYSGVGGKLTHEKNQKQKIS